MKSFKLLTALFTLATLVPLLAQSPEPPVRKKRQAASHLETGAERKLDLTYKKVGKKELKLDLYYPNAKRAKKSPIIIFTHGGGWAAGHRNKAAKGSFAAVFRPLLAEGFAVASVSYRLAKPGTGASMRDCVIDSKDALRYLAKNSETLGLDSNQVYLFGDSAGGHIAQMLLLSPPETLKGDPTLSDATYQIVAGLSWYGPCDFQEISLFNDDDRPDFRDRFGPRILGYREDVSPEEKKRLYREMSPVTYLKKDSPPLLMIQGDKDTTIPVKHAYRMQKRAEEIQAPVTISIVKNSGHNWRSVDAPTDPTRAEIIQESINFFIQQAKDFRARSEQ